MTKDEYIEKLENEVAVLKAKERQLLDALKSQDNRIERACAALNGEDEEDEEYDD